MDRSKPSGPAYFIIDNFARYFKLDQADLLTAKEEVKNLTNLPCKLEPFTSHARCDSLVWLE